MVLGATGLVGRELVRALLRDGAIARVVAPARRAVEPPEGIAAVDTAKLDLRVVDFDSLGAQRAMFTGVEQIFCALGTTIRQAGSQERFRRVDHDYPLAAARLGREAGAGHFLLVSALGADPSSRIFYNRVKGEVERDVADAGYPSLTIVRPSLLLGDRGEFRLGEVVAKRLAWMVPGKWAPVEAADVARCMVALASTGHPGTRIIESRDLPRRARTAGR